MVAAASLGNAQDQIVYKIVPAALWQASESTGVFTGSPIDVLDGFIHLSAGHQVHETAARHFAGIGGLLLVAVAIDALDVRWEPSRDGDLFPHLYGPLPFTAVRSVAPFPIEEAFVKHDMTTTAFTLDGYRILESKGVVRGVIVRSRSVIGTLGATLQTLVGGNISLFTELCERTREDAFQLMLEHARQHGANAVIGIRYDATEVMGGVTEVLCYGTAVVVVQQI